MDSAMTLTDGVSVGYYNTGQISAIASTLANGTDNYTYGYDAAGDLATTSLGGTLVQGTIWDLNNRRPQVAEETSPAGATIAARPGAAARALVL